MFSGKAMTSCVARALRRRRAALEGFSLSNQLAQTLKTLRLPISRVLRPLGMLPFSICQVSSIPPHANQKSEAV